MPLLSSAYTPVSIESIVQFVTVMLVHLYKKTPSFLDAPSLQLLIVMLEQFVRDIQCPVLFEIAKPVIVLLLMPEYTIGAEEV